MFSDEFTVWIFHLSVPDELDLTNVISRLCVKNKNSASQKEKIRPHLSNSLTPKREVFTLSRRGSALQQSLNLCTHSR